MNQEERTRRTVVRAGWSLVDWMREQERQTGDLVELARLIGDRLALERTLWKEAQDGH